MATEPQQPDLDDETDTPSEEEIERQRRSIADWKHPDDGKELSDRDQERSLKP